MTTTYEPEILDDNDDDGTMPQNVAALTEAVVGHRIVSVEEGVQFPSKWGGTEVATAITLDNGKRVMLADTSDCCAFTELKSFLLYPERVDHVITGVGTTDGFETWHIFADYGDVLALNVEWSPGNPFYYGYGFDITVRDAEVAA